MKKGKLLFLPRVFIFFMLCLSFTGTPLMANDAYVLSGVEVTLQEYLPPEKARTKAIEEATEKGFTQLLQRLTAQTAWAEHAEIIKKADMRRVLDKFHLTEETLRPSYRAVFELRFNQSYIHNLLSRLSVPFSEVRAGTVLLLPLLDLGEKQLLWEESNPWRQKLAKAAEDAGLVKFVLPIGDPQEMTLLTPEMVAFGAGDMMLQIAQNYGAKSVVVARFQMGLKPDGQREALLDLAWYGEHSVKPQYLQLPLSSDQGLDVAMQTVATQAIHAVEEAWRQLYILEFNQPGQILVTHGAPTLAGVQQVMAQLKAIPIVEDVFLRLISRQQAVLQVNFFGANEKLQTLAAEAQVPLRPWGERWVVDLGTTQDNIQAYGLIKSAFGEE